MTVDAYSLLTGANLSVKYSGEANLTYAAVKKLPKTHFLL